MANIIELLYHLIMNNDYLFRKQQELNILNSYLSKPFSIGKLNNANQILKIEKVDKNIFY